MSSPATALLQVRDLVRTPPFLPVDERVGTAAELLRVSPYRCVPVVSYSRLVGLVTDASLTQFLLDAPSDPLERRRWLEASVEQVTVPLVAAVSPELGVVALLQALDEQKCDVLPVLEASGNYLGLVGRMDLARELLRPLSVPLLGGMATPLGVYLTTGTLRAGASQGALILTGMCFFGVQGILLLLLSYLEYALPPVAVPIPVRETFDLLLTTSLSMFGFLGVIRLTPLAGYHAAEHQVVNAIEHHVPLLPERVRAQSRVHPRCGTNFAAAVFLLGLGGAFLPVLGNAAYILAVFLAVGYWRLLGAWFQEKLTTRPATDAQLAQGIAAAKELLAKHDATPYAAVSPLKRLWFSGLPQILLGYLLGLGTLWVLSLLIPPLGSALAPHWETLLAL